MLGRLKRIVLPKAFRRISLMFLRKDMELIVGKIELLENNVRKLDDPSSARIILGLIAAEDHRYFDHVGVDFRAVVRALRGYVYGKSSGGSTLEQQLVRVLRNRYEVTAKRKVSEIFLAVSLNDLFEKEFLCLAYAFVAYYGSGGHGLEQISKRFELAFDDISANDAVLLASLLKRPLPWHPSVEYLEKLDARKNHVMSRLINICRSGKLDGLVARADLRNLSFARDILERKGDRQG